MNTKSFAVGFAVMDSIIDGISEAKRGIAHAAKSPVHCTKNGMLATSEVVTSFFAGAKQAIKYRKELENINKRPMLTVIKEE